MKLKAPFLLLIFFSIQKINAELYLNVAISPAPNWANCGGYGRCWNAPWGIGWPFYGYGYGPGYGFTPPANAYQTPMRLTPYVYQRSTRQQIEPDSPENNGQSEPDIDQDSME